MKSLAKTINILLAEKDMSQSDLAKTLGVNRQQISKYLSGKHAPSIETLFRIAEALGIPAFYILMSPEDRALWDVVTRVEHGKSVLGFGRDLNQLMALLSEDLSQRKKKTP